MVEAGQTWEEKERRREALEMALADAIGGRAGRAGSPCLVRIRWRAER